MKSMTGYGSYESQSDNYHLKIDMKSVNNRYCDIFIKLPALLFSYEDKIKIFIKKDVKRGKVEVFIKLNKLSKDDNSFDVDLPLAKNYYNASRDISNYLGLNNNLSIKDIITMPGVLVESEDNEVSKELEDLLFTTLTKTLESFITSRLSEGQAIKEDFKTKLSSIKDIVAKVEELSPISLKENEEKLKNKLNNYLDESEIDRQRIATECFLLVDKLSIDEEITRLKIHLERFNHIMNLEESIGRKLDFLLQEINREINTIGSKSNNIDILNNVVLVKSEVERIREQVQNIE
ncbi:MAG: YicC/YloC family endoribonuclease [Peptoniphilus lacrimalis]|uniref:YicC/YloC family endoribonuclease n=1 Tax=Peptoniphilus lacrimalis TaxID=33031 RepID=UPI00254E0C6C|nr:YicC/YloC family endoribonuclease [Peptoniphilus lacrimalis]MDK8282321.1 YicC/YloC family endoribonuclease [Peptoniphilus lacrimalis]